MGTKNAGESNLEDAKTKGDGSSLEEGKQEGDKQSKTVEKQAMPRMMT